MTPISKLSLLSGDMEWEEFIHTLESDQIINKQQSFNDRSSQELNKKNFDKIKYAAVLVPLVIRNDQITIVFTKRPSNMNEHAGQISFPGGKRESSDYSPQDTALREAEEEIGLSRRDVTTLGRLNDYVVGTGYNITPVVGIVDPSSHFVPNVGEVEEIFEVPLLFALDDLNYRKDSIVELGVEISFHVIEYKKRLIWGATAAILVDLREVILASR